jgi:hypothetical protein
MFDRRFSFVWIPTRHHVLFRRPTPEQTLALMRDTLSKEDELENMREHLMLCLSLEMTDSLARVVAGQTSNEPFRRISREKDLKLMENEIQGAQDRSNRFKFWNVHKWPAYMIDGVLGHDKKNSNQGSDHEYLQ